MNLYLQGKAPDWQDFVGIITLLVINSTISFIEENNAGNAAAALMASLAPKAKVSNSIQSLTIKSLHLERTPFYYLFLFTLLFVFSRVCFCKDSSRW